MEIINGDIFCFCGKIFLIDPAIGSAPDIDFSGVIDLVIGAKNCSMFRFNGVTEKSNIFDAYIVVNKEIHFKIDDPYKNSLFKNYFKLYYNEDFEAYVGKYASSIYGTEIGKVYLYLKEMKFRPLDLNSQNFDEVFK